MKTSTKSLLLKDITLTTLQDLSQSWNEPAWVWALRAQAFKNYEALPWPDKRNERWKRTELENLNWDKQRWDPFVSFSFSPTPELEEKKVEWIPLPQALLSHQHLIEMTWKYAIEKAKDNKFQSLTLALGRTGSLLIIPKSQNVRFAFDAFSNQINSVEGALFPLHFVIVEEAADLQLWEELQGPAGFVSSYLHLTLKENARAACYYLQRWDKSAIHFQFQDVEQGSHSKFSAVAVAMGGRIFRNETDVHLSGQGAENKVLGVLFGDADQNFENWITQDHSAPKTVSDIQYRGALKGKAKSFFSGMVSIKKQAQQSDAYQSAKSLLLSKDARADAIPNLEILADDVKCSHGAAVGQVNEDQKFYLQSRGIPPDQAEEIVIQGFFEPVISEVPSPAVQERLRNFVEEKLK